MARLDAMIAVRNSYWLAENLPNAVLLTYPGAGHGSLVQYPDSFTRHAIAFPWRRIFGARALLRASALTSDLRCETSNKRR